MHYRILGPLEVTDGDRVVALGAGRQPALLALLLLNANEVVPSERLIDELWGEAPPATAAKSVQVLVSHLRRALAGGGGAADEVVLTRAGGYLMRIVAGELDVHRAEQLLAEGRRALQADQPEAAARRLHEALALWRGEPLVDFSYEPFAQAEIARLQELRMAVLEERVEADLAAVAAIGGDARRAARLAGAASACCSRRDPVRARLDADFLAPARARCAPDEWDAARRDGAALEFGDAIAYALDDRG